MLTNRISFILEVCSRVPVQSMQEKERSPYDLLLTDGIRNICGITEAVQKIAEDSCGCPDLTSRTPVTVLTRTSRRLLWLSWPGLDKPKIPVADLDKPKTPVAVLTWPGQAEDSRG